MTARTYHEYLAENGIWRKKWRKNEWITSKSRLASNGKTYCGKLQATKIGEAGYKI